MPTRVLILTASVGEGHDLPARTLAAQLRRERADVEVVTEDCLPALGRFVAAISAGAPRLVFYRFQWVWDFGFWFFALNPLTRRLTQLVLTRFAAPGVLRLVESRAPDVIVSVYPNVTEVLGWLRARGRIGVPVVAGITDLAAMHYWAAPGVDLYLVTHPESVDEVREVAGVQARVRAVHGFTAAEFLAPRTQADARAALALPAHGKVVLVSGGGWGVGDIEGAVEEALRLDEVAAVVCLCGRNEELRARLAVRFAHDARVRVEGFTQRMADWLAAGDALVHSTGGLTVLEAIMCGCPPISYGWGRGHVRLNNEAFRRFGLAEVVPSRAELAESIARAIERRNGADPAFAAFPSAASLVLELVDRVG